MLLLHNSFESLRTLQKKREGIEQPCFIDETAEIGKNIYIGAFAYIGKNVRIGENVHIYPHCYIGDHVTIKNNSTLYSGVKVYHNCHIDQKQYHTFWLSNRIRRIWICSKY